MRYVPSFTGQWLAYLCDLAPVNHVCISFSGSVAALYHAEVSRFIDRKALVMLDLHRDRGKDQRSDPSWHLTVFDTIALSIMPARSKANHELYACNHMQLSAGSDGAFPTEILLPETADNSIISAWSCM